MKTTRPLLLLSAILLGSCASDSGTDKSKPAATPQRKSLSERMSGESGYKQDANGNWVAQSEKRSPYESVGQDPNFTKDFKKQEYKTGDYTKKSWWGNKNYDSKSYAGNTDGSRFQKASALDGKGAREAGSNAKIPDPYKTGTYATGDAREAGKNSIAKPSNDGIENRREVYEAPEIMDWKEQRKLSMDQSKGILGH